MVIPQVMRICATSNGEQRVQVLIPVVQGLPRKYLNIPRVPWRHKRREMMTTAEIISVAKWLGKIKQRSDVSCRLCIRAPEQRDVSTEICQKRRMGTSTVLSAMEWQQPSRLPITSSGDICMPACKLHKHQRVSSGLSHLID